MTQIRFTIYLAFAIILTACQQSEIPAPQANSAAQHDIDDDAPPNIVLVFVDDLDFDELNTYKSHSDPSLHVMPTHTDAGKRGLFSKNKDGYELGYPHVKKWMTPTLDQMAQDGVIFKRFYVTSPVCTPSRFALLTGKYASRNKELKAKAAKPNRYNDIEFIGFNTPLEYETTLASYLKALGYGTGMVGKWHNMNFDNRINYHLSREDDPRDPEVAAKIKQVYENGVTYLKKTSDFDKVYALQGNNIQALSLPEPIYNNHGHNLEWIMAGANRFIEEESQSGAPFFLYLSLPVPHGWMGQLSPTSDAVYSPEGVLSAIPQSGMPPRETAAQRLGGRSPAEMALYMDDAIGALFDKLKQVGAYDNTIVLFISDHQNRGKESLYEGARVPAMMQWPRKITGGQVIEGVSASIDIAPTLLALSGQTPEDIIPGNTLDGLSLWPLLKGVKQDVRDYLLLEISSSRAIVGRKWKYIANRAPQEILDHMEAEKDLPPFERNYGWSSEWFAGMQSNFRTPNNGINYRPHSFFPDYFDYDQIYDLENDMFEQRNLWPESKIKAVRRELVDELSRQIKATGQVFSEFGD